MTQRRGKAIIKSNDSLFYWRIYVSRGLNELKAFEQQFNNT